MLLEWSLPGRFHFYDQNKERLIGSMPGKISSLVFTADKPPLAWPEYDRKAQFELYA
jgi:hypothetical protein